MTRTERRVTFSEDATVRLFDRNPVLEEKDNIWYSEGEIQKQRKNDVLMMGKIKRDAPSLSSSPDVLIEVFQALQNESCQQHPPTWDIRGLESWVDGGYQRSRRRFNAVLAVLMEQDRQGLEGDFSECKIAEQYHRYSEISLRSAHRKAELDRKAVQVETMKGMTKGHQLVSSDFSRYHVDTPVLHAVPSRAA